MVEWLEVRGFSTEFTSVFKGVLGDLSEGDFESCGSAKIHSF